ncbi:aquaporin-7-like isoform X4 [Apus apus]|uniref:aquaporin-7-like isoform X4 n=1 Tax=Apus apus TaxID=8895 RepID=UPI0021F863DF|nr:aquaporin-7-like isoform X4 [Apus apus]
MALALLFLPPAPADSVVRPQRGGAASEAAVSWSCAEGRSQEGEWCLHGGGDRHSCSYRPEPESSMLEKVQKSLTIRNTTIRELLAEALGMFILMVFGLSSVAQVVLGRGKAGEHMSICFGFGIGVTLGIHAAGGISGAHLNGAITFTHCILGNLPWRKFPAYLAGQFLGSFTAAAAVFALYYDALHDYSNGNFTVTGPNATASIFSTYPAPHVSLLGSIFTEAHLNLQAACQKVRRCFSRLYLCKRRCHCLLQWSWTRQPLQSKLFYNSSNPNYSMTP